MSSLAGGILPASAERLAAGREVHYTRQDFERVRKLIHARAGISLAAGKEDLVYGRLARRLRQHGLERFSDYLDQLEGSDDSEWQAFVNALTTNLTSFFREPHHFDALRELLEQRPAGSRIKLWSAAASTGEEAYSMAMCAVEHFNSFDIPVDILATDIDTQVLDTAQCGVYPLERVERLPMNLKRRYFLRGSADYAGCCRVRDELRRLIEFRSFNLLSPQWNLKGPFSAIFCRNVMIYFDKPTQRRIIEKSMPLLAADGLFFAGHSESFFHCQDLMRTVGRTIYSKVITGGAS